MKFTLIMGNISFDDDAVKIHSIDMVKQFDSSKQAEEMGEELCNKYGAYIIPEIYNQKPIVFDMI